MATPAEHDPGCVLDPANWLRHAVAAAAHLMASDTEVASWADRQSAAALLNALELLSQQTRWRSVTLLEVTQFAPLMGATFAGLCTCGGAPSAELQLD